MKLLLPQNKNGIWYLIRRVPRAYAHVDPRKFVKISTGIKVADDPRGARAAKVVVDLNAQLEKDWIDLLAGKQPDQRHAYDRARRTAEALGLSYLPATELASGPLNELLRRIELIDQMKAGNNEKVVDAIAGGVDRPVLMISELAEAFEAEQAASLKGKSPDQLKRWRENKKRAVRIALSVFGGDKRVLDLTRDDGIKLRKHFQARVLEDGLSINSANIEMGHFTVMLRTIERERHMGIPIAAFQNLVIQGGKGKHRPPFDTDFIQNKILAEGALDGLDPEARSIMLVMIDTGMRPSEIFNLLPHHIHLDAPVPFVQVRPEGRALKTDPSERDMPLVGCALAALRRHPKGFPSYYDKGKELSETINNYLRDAGLRQTPEHTLYSFRHSFEDRLTQLDPPDKIIGRFMGHKQFREKYGKGPTLEHLHSWISRIAFRPPTLL